METAGAFSPWLPDRFPNGIRVIGREEPKMGPGEVEGRLVTEALPPARGDWVPPGARPIPGRRPGGRVQARGL